MPQLSKFEINHRLQKLRNYENILYPNAKEQKEKWKEKARKLERENKRLKAENKQIEKLQLELEELREMKFGKRKSNSHFSAKTAPLKDKGKKKKKRSSCSYRRASPSPEAITDELRLEIENCPECGAELIDKKEHIHYREDLYEVEALIKSAQKIVKTIIESGRCQICRQRCFAMEVPKQNVIIGTNVRMMIVYLLVIQGQSYTEIQKSLLHQYGIKVSSGEIGNILEGESLLLTPYYDYIFETLEAELACHYDETSWKTRDRGKEVGEGNYCWIKTGVLSSHQIFWFGRSRGKGVAEALRGRKEGSVGISDDYGSYRHLFDRHQLCWAHPLRKLRDLAESKNLKGKKKQRCNQVYKNFSQVYKASEKARQQLLKGSLSNEVKSDRKAKLEGMFAQLFLSEKDDPVKLSTILTSLEKRKERYFTFFDFPQLPLDNNKAERALRKVVLKRKKSFGCQSQKGADVLSILYSVVFSLIENNPEKNFFTLYKQALDFEGQ